MQKTRKNFVLIATVCMMIAAILFTAGMFFLDWKFAKLDTSKYTAKAFDAFNTEIENIDIDIDSKKLVIKPTDTAQPTPRIDWFDSETETLSVSFVNKTLTIRSKYKFKLSEIAMFNGLNTSKQTVTLYLPQTNFNSVKLKADSGSIHFSHMQAQTISLKADSGKIKCSNIQAQKITLKADSGSIYAKNVLANTLTASADSGKIELKNVQTSTATLTASSGKISLSNLEVNTLTATANSGSVTGSIKGIKTEYSIFTQKSSGSIKPKAQTGTTDKKLILKANSGKVNIGFVN